jgi:predicted secreted protein with PEFG-CTERM motif
LKVYRVKSDSAFNVTFPKNNIFSAQEGPTQSFSEGFWVFLKPLTPGEHVLHVQGSLVDPTITSPVNLVEDSTYNLSVVAAQPGSDSQPNVHQQEVSISNKSFVFPITSNSNIRNINFNEQTKTLAFEMAAMPNSNGTNTVSMPISWLLVGPYGVFIDDNSSKLYNSTKDPESGQITLTINPAGVDNSSHKVRITGASVTPEFPLAIVVLVITISGVVLLTRKVGRRMPLTF